MHLTLRNNGFYTVPVTVTAQFITVISFISDHVAATFARPSNTAW